jgi:hypothetical protein
VECAGGLPFAKILTRQELKPVHLRIMLKPCAFVGPCVIPGLPAIIGQPTTISGMDFSTLIYRNNIAVSVFTSLFLKTKNIK